LLLAQGRQCAVCDISIPEVLDAAHIVPKEEHGTDDHRNGLVLCSLHHRMFDAGMFRIDPRTLVIDLLNKNYSFQDLRMTRQNISHVAKHPHRESLRWHWDYTGVQRDTLMGQAGN
jgi:putative restriction endonuclease